MAQRKEPDTRYLMAVSTMQSNLNSMVRLLNVSAKDGEMDEQTLTRLVRVIDSYTDEAGVLAESIAMNFFTYCDQELIRKHGVRLDRLLFGGDGADGA